MKYKNISFDKDMQEFLDSDEEGKLTKFFIKLCA